MARTVYVTVAALLLVLAAFVYRGVTAEATPALYDSVVKINVGGGHGSGVHIGHGYIVTAAHVVKGAQTIEVVSSTGAKEVPTVLWVNEDFDVALVKISDFAGFDAAPLACRVPEPGENIVAKGNPASMDFVSVWGRVGGAVRKVGPWQEVVVTNITVVPGQSGGPVYDADGDVVAITVGVMVVPVGFGGSMVGVGYAVPGKTVCNLLARG